MLKKDIDLMHSYVVLHYQLLGVLSYLYIERPLESATIKMLENLSKEISFEKEKLERQFDKFHEEQKKLEGEKHV